MGRAIHCEVDVIEKTIEIMMEGPFEEKHFFKFSINGHHNTIEYDGRQVTYTTLGGDNAFHLKFIGDGNPPARTWGEFLRKIEGGQTFQGTLSYLILGKTFQVMYKEDGKSVKWRFRLCRN